MYSHLGRAAPKHASNQLVRVGAYVVLPRILWKHHFVHILRKQTLPWGTGYRSIYRSIFTVLFTVLLLPFYRTILYAAPFVNSRAALVPGGTQHAY